MRGRRHRFLTALSALVVAAASIITAPAASAAPSPNPIFIVPDDGSDCSGIRFSEAATVRDQASSGSVVSTIDASNGRILSVTNNCLVDLVARVEDEAGALLALPDFPSSVSTEVDITGAAAITFYREDPPNEFNSVANGVFIVNSAAPSSGSMPPPVLQQFGKPSTGTCDEAAPADLNWGGSSSGGWGDSWAQWMNDGAGGDVCTRTLVYNNSSGRWSPSNS